MQGALHHQLMSSYLFLLNFTSKGQQTFSVWLATPGVFCSHGRQPDDEKA